MEAPQRAWSGIPLGRARRPAAGRHAQRRTVPQGQRGYRFLFKMLALVALFGLARRLFSSLAPCFLSGLAFFGLVRRLLSGLAFFGLARRLFSSLALCFLSGLVLLGGAFCLLNSGPVLFGLARGLLSSGFVLCFLRGLPLLG